MVTHAAGNVKGKSAEMEFKTPKNNVMMEMIKIMMGAQPVARLKFVEIKELMPLSNAMMEIYKMGMVVIQHALTKFVEMVGLMLLLKSVMMEILWEMMAVMPLASRKNAAMVFEKDQKLVMMETW